MKHNREGLLAVRSDVQHHQPLHMYLVSVTLWNNVLVKLIRTYICTPTNYIIVIIIFCKKNSFLLFRLCNGKVDPLHAMRAFGKWRISWTITNLCNRWTKVGSLCWGRFTPNKKITKYPLNTRNGGNQSQSEFSWEEEYLLTPPGIEHDSSVLQPTN
jgi:hypothetical protein